MVVILARVILERTKLLSTVIFPIGVIFLHPQAFVIHFKLSILFLIFVLVILSISSMIYSMPRAVKEFTQSSVFSLPNLLSDSLIYPILITYVLV